MIPIIDNLSPETNAKDLNCALKKIDTEYQKTAKGPAKLKVFEDFMKVERIYYLILIIHNNYLFIGFWGSEQCTMAKT